MADKTFRVLLDLNDLHIESLKYVWVNVSSEELKTIADFKTSIRHKINLAKIDIKLFVRNGLLLDDETVLILREDDTVKVQYENQWNPGYNDITNSVQENRMSSRKRNHSDGDSINSVNSKRYKTDSKSVTQENEISFGAMKKKKKKQSQSIRSEKLFNQPNAFEADKHNTVKIHKKKDEKQITLLKKNIADISLLDYEPFFSIDNQDTTLEKNENNTFKTDINVDPSYGLKLSSPNDSVLKSDLSLEQEKVLKKQSEINTGSLKEYEGLGNNCPKKKRKRHKKRKKVVENVINACGSIDVNNEFKSFTNETNASVQTKLIVYSPSPCKEPEVIPIDYNINNGKVENLPTNTYVMETNVSNVNIESSHNYPKVSTPARSNYCENPNWCVSAMQAAILNSNSNESDSFKKEKKKNFVHTKGGSERSVTSETVKNTKEISELQYTDFPPLNSRPDIGTHIAYKILELDEHYSPVISGYREGIVKSINVDNEEMEIELLKHVIKPGRTGKFENLKEDEIPPPEIKRCDTIKWTALVEPKLVF